MKISFDSGLVAILRTKTESDARDMAKALVNAGIKLIEFTTTTPGALNLVEEFSANKDLYVGLGTCIMSAVVYWPEVYRERFAIGDSKIIAFGIAIGYPDLETNVNNFPRSREPLDRFVQWYGM